VDVFVNDNQADSGFTIGGTVEDALRHVQANLCAPGHVVVSVRCDGQGLSGEAMAAALQKPASSFERLDVFTDTKEALVSDAMGNALASLTETDAACRRVAELLTEGKTVEAAETLSDCLSIWQQIHVAVARSIEILRLDPEQIRVDGEPLTELIGKPREVLLQVKEALQARDHVLLADILQYEFQEVTGRWHDIATRLRDEAEDLKASRRP